MVSEKPTDNQATTPLVQEQTQPVDESSAETEKRYQTLGEAIISEPKEVLIKREDLEQLPPDAVLFEGPGIGLGWDVKRLLVKLDSIKGNYQIKHTSDGKIKLMYVDRDTNLSEVTVDPSRIGSLEEFKGVDVDFQFQNQLKKLNPAWEKMGLHISSSLNKAIELKNKEEQPQEVQGFNF